MSKVIDVLFVLFVVAATVGSIVMAAGDAVSALDFFIKQIIAFCGLVFMPTIIYVVSKV